MSFTDHHYISHVAYVPQQRKSAATQTAQARILRGCLKSKIPIYVDVAPYMQTSKHSLMWLALWGNVANPHYCESYYLLATKLE